MGDLVRFVAYTGVVYVILGSLMAAQALFGGRPELPEVAVAAALGPVAAGFAMWTQHHAAALLAALVTGRHQPPDREPALAKVRSYLKQERWTEARDELDVQWLQFPGHREVLMEMEHCYLDGLHAAAAFAEFLDGAVAITAGETRAYVLLRLAELHADALDRRDDARGWCARVLTEFPASPHAETARRLREQLDARAPSAP